MASVSLNLEWEAKHEIGHIEFKEYAIVSHGVHVDFF